MSVWTMVHAAKLGSWSLLVVVSIVLVAGVKAYEGRLYGDPRNLSVLRAGPTPPRRWVVVPRLVQRVATDSVR